MITLHPRFLAAQGFKRRIQQWRRFHLKVMFARAAGFV
jgi:hypothetical protein